MLINSLREDTEYLLDFRCERDGGVKPYSARCFWLGESEPIPVPRIKCIKYGNLNQVKRAEIYFLRRESLVEKINARIVGDCIGFMEVVFSSFTTDELSKHTTCVTPVGMYIIKKSRFKFLCAFDECNLTTRILRLLEPIEVPRMVDIDILMEIWKNREKKIDFVLKWLSRVGSEVGPTKVLYEGDTRNRWRDGQVCPDVDKELWRLGPHSSGQKERGVEKKPGERKTPREREKIREKSEEEQKEREESPRGKECEARLEWRKRAEFRKLE
ncbi:hypothetical protein TNCV_3117221 [Trichonephila clavipes]|nr:hypothetical protein TNCV_3117221 [Trichonephila clavipes]